MLCWSANGATNVTTPVDARPPTANTMMALARVRALDGPGPVAGDGAAAMAASGNRRQNHAPTAATTAASMNTECAPQRAAIGSATAGPIALIDSAAAPNKPIACASFALGATSATRVIPAAKNRDH